MNEKIKQLIDAYLEKIITEHLGGEEGKPEGKESFIGKYVIVRGYYAGVRAGKLLDDTPGSIILEDARMLWRRRAKSGVGLAGVASTGLDPEHEDEIKITEQIKKVQITDENVSTFLATTKEVEEQIRNYPVTRRE